MPEIERLYRAVADEFDILPSDDFSLVCGVKFSIPRGHVDDFRSVKADGLCDNNSPTLAESALK